MSRLLVVGGTGTAGRAIAGEAIERGHEVVVASRRVPAEGSAAFLGGAHYIPVDLVTTDGFDEALEDIDVLIDATNGVGRKARPVLTVGALNLMHAAARWGIERAVLLSIVNVDKSNYSYYRAKAAQEEIYRDSPLETRIVRSTQFHDLVASFFRAGARFGVIPALSKVSFQTIALADIANILVDTAEGTGQPNVTFSVGGPEVLTSREMAEAWKKATRSRAVIVPARAPGSVGALWRSGGALVPEHAVGRLSYAEWLDLADRP